MSRLSLTVGSIFLMLPVLGCMHKGSNNTASKAVSSYEDSDQDLTADIGSRPLRARAAPPAEDVENTEPDQGVCEREYSETNCIMMYEPVACIAGSFLVEGGNRCDATKKAKMQACLSGQAFDEAKLECFAGDKAKACVETQEICTRERIETRCSVEDAQGAKVEAIGSNACLARKNLAKMFCLRDSKLDPAAIACKPLAAE